VRAAKTGGEKDIGFKIPSSEAIEWKGLQRGSELFLIRNFSVDLSFMYPRLYR